MQRHDLIGEIPYERSDVFLIPLPADKLFPCFAKILKRGDVFQRHGTTLHENSIYDTPPPQGFQSNQPPVLQKTLEAYKLWHVFHQGFPRLSKHTLGEKIDRLFTELIESLFLAGYSAPGEKTVHIIAASARLDLLKYFTQVAWELKCLDHKRYAAMTPPLVEIGKMIGGWIKHMEHKTPPA